jgi:hypothetical protein
MEMTVAIEEWLKRIPDFRLDPAGKVRCSAGTVRGPRQLPILFGKGYHGAVRRDPVPLPPPIRLPIAPYRPYAGQEATA